MASFQLIGSGQFLIGREYLTEKKMVDFLTSFYLQLDFYFITIVLPLY